MKVWKASSFEYAITRTQDDDLISCLDRKFDNYMCMDEDDFKKLLESYDACNCK